MLVFASQRILKKPKNAYIATSENRSGEMRGLITKSLREPLWEKLRVPSSRDGEWIWDEQRREGKETSQSLRWQSRWELMVAEGRAAGSGAEEPQPNSVGRVETRVQRARIFLHVRELRRKLSPKRSNDKRDLALWHGNNPSPDLLTLFAMVAWVLTLGEPAA